MYYCEVRTHTTKKPGRTKTPNKLKGHNRGYTRASNKDGLPKESSRSTCNTTSGYRKKQRCLMCRNLFCHEELEKHLWLCKVKRPCLNRVNEIKVEFEVKI